MVDVNLVSFSHDLILPAGNLRKKFETPTHSENYLPPMNSFE